MTRLAMMIDVDRCLGCQACMVACTNENELPTGHHRTRMQTTVVGSFPDLRAEIRVEQCFQCEESPCVKVCPTGATYKTADGVIRVDQARCIGCKACVMACPYRMRYIHPDGYADKCDFCYHRLEQGRAPACVETCPTDARIFGDLEDPASGLRLELAAATPVTVMKPETKTRPRVFYAGADTAIGTGLAEVDESEWNHDVGI